MHRIQTRIGKRHEQDNDMAMVRIRHGQGAYLGHVTGMDLILTWTGQRHVPTVELA